MAARKGGRIRSTCGPSALADYRDDGKLSVLSDNRRGGPKGFRWGSLPFRVKIRDSYSPIYLHSVQYLAKADVRKPDWTGLNLSSSRNVALTHALHLILFLSGVTRWALIHCRKYTFTLCPNVSKTNIKFATMTSNPPHDNHCLVHQQLHYFPHVLLVALPPSLGLGRLLSVSAACSSPPSLFGVAIIHLLYVRTSLFFLECVLRHPAVLEYPKRASF